MGILEIENEIKKLSAEKVGELFDWLGRYHAEVWEKQIEDDLESGRLDSVLSTIEVEIGEGLAKPL